LYEANRSSPINMKDASGAWPEFVNKGMAVAREVASGALRSEMEFAKEVATTVVAVTPVGQVAQAVQLGLEIKHSKDPIAATVAVAKDKITTIVPPAATGFALLEGRGLHEGVEDTVKKVPFSKVATDVDKTVRAASRGDTAGVVEHGTGAVRHFAQQVGDLILAAGGESKGGGKVSPPEPAAATSSPKADVPVGNAPPASSPSSAPAAPRRWRVGDPHDAPTAKGTPQWKTVKSRYWRNRAASAAPGEFSPENQALVERGRAPIDPGSGLSTELEHIKPQRTGAPDMHRDLLEVTPLEHSFFDRHRKFTDPAGRSFRTNRQTDPRP